jgi:hypothetical protein
MPDGIIEEPLPLRPDARSLVQDRHQIWPAALELIVQQLAEEVMIAIPFALPAQGNHKQVGARELTQELGGTHPIRNRVAKRPCQRPQHRGLEQKPLRILSEARQGLLCQQVDDIAVTAPERLDVGVLVLPLLQGEGGEVDRRGPPFGTLDQYGDVSRTEIQPHLLVQQESGFLLREGELPGADLIHLVPCSHTPQ